MKIIIIIALLIIAGLGTALYLALRALGKILKGVCDVATDKAVNGMSQTKK